MFYVVRAGVLMGLLLFPTLAIAQAAPVETHEGDAPGQLPPLEAVLAHVLLHAPRLKMQDALIEKNHYTLARAKLDLLDGVTAGVSTTYGSYGNTVLDEISLGMTAGFSIRFSLFDLFSQRSRRGTFRKELEVSIHKRDEIREDVQRLIIALYNKVLLTQRLVGIKSEARRTTEVHLRMAEAEFAQGDIPVSELARVTEIASKARAEYETARYDYITAYAQLENLLGTRLNTLNHDPG